MSSFNYGSLEGSQAGGGGGGGTVTSVGLALPADTYTISGSPVITTGTLTGAYVPQNANLMHAGPSSGGPAAPTWRALLAADIPTTLGATTFPGITISPNTGIINWASATQLLSQADGTLQILTNAGGVGSILLGPATTAGVLLQGSLSTLTLRNNAGGSGNIVAGTFASNVSVAYVNNAAQTYGFGFPTATTAAIYTAGSAAITFDNLQNATVGGGTKWTWTGRAIFSSPGDGQFLITNNAATQAFRLNTGSVAGSLSITDNSGNAGPVTAAYFLSAGATQQPDAGAKFSAFGVTGVAGGNAYYYAQDSTAANKAYFGVTSGTAFMGSFNTVQFDIRMNNVTRFSVLTTAQVGTANQGTAAAPIYTLTSTPSSGMYFPTTTSLGFSSNGSAALIFDSTQNAVFSATVSGNRLLVLSSPTTLTVAQSAAYAVYIGTTNSTALPTGTSGTYYDFCNTGSGLLTVTSGSANITGNGLTAASSRTLTAGGTMRLVFNGTNWYVQSATGTVA